MFSHVQGTVPTPAAKATINEEILIDQVHLHPCLYDSTAEGYKDHTTRSKAWDDVGTHLNVKGEQAKEAWEKLRRCFMNAIKRRQSKQMHPWRFAQKMSFLYNHIDPMKLMARYESDEQQYYPESDDRSFTGESDISSPKVFDCMAEVPISTPGTMIPQDSVVLKHEENSNGSYGSEQSRSRPDSEPLRLREIPEASIEANHFPNEKLSPISNDQPETIAVNNSPKKQWSFEGPSNEPVEATRKRKRKSSGNENEEHFRAVGEKDDIDIFFLSMAKTTKTLKPIEQARIKLQVSQIVLNAQIASLEQSAHHG